MDRWLPTSPDESDADMEFLRPQVHKKRKKLDINSMKNRKISMGRKKVDILENRNLPLRGLAQPQLDEVIVNMGLLDDKLDIIRMYIYFYLYIYILICV